MNVHFSSKYLFYLPDLWGYLRRFTLFIFNFSVENMPNKVWQFAAFARGAASPCCAVPRFARGAASPCYAVPRFALPLLGVL